MYKISDEELNKLKDEDQKLKMSDKKTKKTNIENILLILQQMNIIYTIKIQFAKKIKDDNNFLIEVKTTKKILEKVENNRQRYFPCKQCFSMKC